MVKMSNIDLPLDEIISQKRITLNRQRKQASGGVSSGAVRKLAPQRPQHISSKPTLQRISTTKDIGDVRNHLIQKKRKNMSDARDQLAKMAKSSGDIRDKLNLIRGTENGSSNKKPLDMRQKLNQKKANNQGRKISSGNSRQQQNQSDKFSAGGKTRIQGSSLLRTVSGNKRLESAPRQKITAPVTRTISGGSSSGGAVRSHVALKSRRSDPIGQNSRPIIRTTTSTAPRQQVRQTVVQQSRPVQVRRNVPAQKTVYIREEPQPVYRQMPSGSVRPMRTNPRARLEPLQSDQYIIEEDYEPQPQHRPTVVYRSVPRRPEPAVVYADEQYEEYYEDAPVIYSDQTDSFYADELPPAQEVYIPPPARSQPQYRPSPRSQPQYRPQPQQFGARDQQYVPQHYNAQPLMQERAVNPYSSQGRLVRQQPQQSVRRSAAPVRQAQTSVRQSHTAQVKVPAVRVVGHKVSVSNLHAATREDIEELFGNIGPISSCTMPRPDTAMVIFVNVADAKKSVEVYHNRKLDNHPMQVKIVGTVTDSSSRGNRVRY